MVGDVLVGILLSFKSNGVYTMERLNAATKSANLTLARQQGLIDADTAAMDRHALAVGRVADRYRMMRGMVAGAIAVAGAAFIVDSVKNAAQLQLAMTSVNIATGASISQMDQMRRLVLQTSGVTAQSATTIAQELAASASSGLNRVDRLMSAFPQIARAADVLMFSPKHLDPTQSATQLSQLSHLFGAYSGAPLHNMIDAAVRMMYVQPEALNKLIAQGKQFIPVALGLGVPQQDIFTEATSMGQTGFLQGRGGAGIARFIEYMAGAPMLTAHLSAARRAGMKDLGIFDAQGRNRFIDSSGQFHLEAALKFLEERRQTMKPDRFMADAMSAFLAQAGRWLFAMTNPTAWAQRIQNIQAYRRIAPPGQAVDTMWTAYTKTLGFAWKQFATNFQNVGIAIFTPVLPMLTDLFTNLASSLKVISDWFSNHPKAGFAAAIAGFGIVAASALFAARQLLSLSASISILGDVAAGRSVRTGIVARMLEGVKTFLFGAPFVPLSRGAGGRFVAGTSREAIPAIGSRLGASLVDTLAILSLPLRKLFTPVFDTIANQLALLRLHVFGAAFSPLARDAGGRFIAGTERPAVTGILSPLLKAIGSALEAGKNLLFGPMLKFLQPVIDFVADMLPGLLLRFGTKLIPIVGWVLTAISVFDLLMQAVRHLPELGVVILNWWNRSQGVIGYTIGYVFGSIGRMISAAISGLIGVAGAAVSTLLGNIYLLATPGGQTQLAGLIAASAVQAQKNFDRTQHQTFGGGLGYGLSAGSSGSAYRPNGTQIHVELHSPNFNFPPGTPQQHAETFFDLLTSPPQRISGANPAGALGHYNFRSGQWAY